jgi:CheY-like chemotaxis protein
MPDNEERGIFMNKGLPVVVYVDDEPDNIMVTKASLEDWFEVIGFQSPVDALKELPNIKPEIVLSDLRMPLMTGVEFLELVQQVYPRAVRVIISGNSDENSVIAAIRRAKVFDFVKKPFLPGAPELKTVLDGAYERFVRNEQEYQLQKKLAKPDLMEHPSWLHKISKQLKDSFKDLPQYQVTDKQIEKWSLLIHLAMSAEKRYYHNTQHLFDISIGASAYERLAILFHDVVYAQVDVNSSSGILPQVLEMIRPLVPDCDLKLVLPPLEELPETTDYALLYALFGKKSGDTLTTLDGLNEFLSALVAQKTLGATLSTWDVIKVISCIELTIPFRTKDTKGRLATERLLDRITRLNDERHLNQTQPEIERVVQRAVEVTNRDLWGFSASDPGDFLNGSWKLILESNIPLQKELHTPKEYRIALGKMEAFISYLKPEMIFQRINNFPNDNDYAHLISQCHFNLQAARTYFRAKIIAMAILETLAELTGEEAPIEVFRGDIESDSNRNSRRLENRLDYKIPTVPATETCPIVLELLMLKSDSTIHYDLKNSPLALYLYSRLTHHEFNQSLAVSRRYFNHEVEAFDVLKSYPKRIISAILHAVSETSSSRQSEVLQLKKLIESMTE